MILLKNMKWWGFCLGVLLSLAFVGDAEAQERWRVAVLADTHLSPGRAEAERALRECVSELNVLGDSIDLVLVAGDISEGGDSVSLQRSFDILSQLTVPFLAVPGNHETKWSESLATDFGKIFGYERFSYDLASFRFIGINTGPIIRMLDGHLYSADLKYLEEELRGMPDGMQAILVTHYPLLASDVDNWYKGTQLLRRYPVALVLGGHYHSNRHFFYDGIPGFLTRSTLPNAEGVTGFTLIDLTPETAEVTEYLLPERKLTKWATQKLGLDTAQPVQSLPDNSMNALAKNHVAEVWQAKSDEAFLAPPAVAEGRVFAVDDSGKLWVYDAVSGKLLWSYETGARVVGAPQANASVVAVGNADGNLYCLGQKGGDLLWKRSFPRHLSGAVELYGDTLYIGDSGGTMHAVRISDGALLWSAAVAKSYIEARPFVSDELIIFGAWDDHLYALDRLSGELRWKWRGPRAGMHFSPAAVWPVATEELVFVTAPDRALTAIDLESGATVARHTSDKVRETVALSKDGTRLYSKTMQDEVICLSPSAGLEEVWRCDVGYGYDHAASIPLELRKTVVVATKNGLLGGIEAKTGQRKWLYRIGNTLIHTPIQVDEYHFAYTTMDGVVGVMRILEE